MTRISTLTASVASVLCLAAIFIWVALAAHVPAQQYVKGGRQPQGLCFLHTLVR